jgi:hypothetical protein
MVFLHPRSSLHTDQDDPEVAFLVQSSGMDTGWPRLLLHRIGDLTRQVKPRKLGSHVPVIAEPEIDMSNLPPGWHHSHS